MPLSVVASVILTVASLLGGCHSLRSASGQGNVKLSPDLRIVGELDWSLPVQLTVTRVGGREQVLVVPLGHSYTPTHTLPPGRYVAALYEEGCPTRMTLRRAERVSLRVTLIGDDCEMSVRRG